MVGFGEGEPTDRLYRLVFNGTVCTLFVSSPLAVFLGGVMRGPYMSQALCLSLLVLLGACGALDGWLSRTLGPSTRGHRGRP